MSTRWSAGGRSRTKGLLVAAYSPALHLAHGQESCAGPADSSVRGCRDGGVAWSDSCRTHTRFGGSVVTLRSALCLEGGHKYGVPRILLSDLSLCQPSFTFLLSRLLVVLLLHLLLHSLLHLLLHLERAWAERHTPSLWFTHLRIVGQRMWLLRCMPRSWQRRRPLVEQNLSSLRNRVRIREFQQGWHSIRLLMEGPALLVFLLWLYITMEASAFQSNPTYLPLCFHLIPDSTYNILILSSHVLSEISWNTWCTLNTPPKT